MKGTNRLRAALAAAGWLAAAAHAAPDLPEVKQSAFVDTMTFSGDLRLRGEYFDYADDRASKLMAPAGLKDDRMRERYRLRMKTEYKLKDFLTVTAGLATSTGKAQQLVTTTATSPVVLTKTVAGSQLAFTETSTATTVDASVFGEAVSTNQTMEGMSRAKPIFVDQAFVTYAPAWLGDDGTLAVSGGKMVNPLWRLYSSDVIWDNDLTPEGFAESASYVVGGMVNVFANAMQQVTGEFSGSVHDAWTYSEQLGVETPLPMGLRLTAAGAFHDWHNSSNGFLGQYPTQLGNTRDGSGLSGILLDTYHVAEETAQLSAWVPVPGLDASLPLSIQGTHVQNLDGRDGGFAGIVNKGLASQKTAAKGKFVAKSDEGWQLGAILGKASAPGSFELAYFYKSVQWDATVADVSDSDFGEGGLNRKGNIGWIAWTPNGFFTVSAKMFNVRLLDLNYHKDATGRLTQPDRINRYQLDVSFKF